MTIISHLFFHF